VRQQDKPFSIDKKLVYEAYKAVRGQCWRRRWDGQTIAQFEADLRGNLYKLWNKIRRLLSAAGPRRRHSEEEWRQRLLGVPTVADRGPDGQADD
jgi:retron-type reverse transcriptase